MAKLDNRFDQDNVPEDENDGFGPIPAGMYKARIIDSKEGQNQKKNGRFIELTWQIDGPKYANRMVWQYINYMHKNATAQAIGQRELKQIGEAVGKWPIEDTADLHGTPCMIRLVIKQEAGYDPKNLVKRVKRLENKKADPGKRPKRARREETSDDAGAYEPDEDLSDELDDEIPF